MAGNHLLIIVAAISFASTATASAQAPETPSHFWQSMNELEKTLYLRGVADGAVLAENSILQFYQRAESRVLWFKEPPKGYKSFDSAAVGMVSGYTSIYGRAEPIVAIMDKSYADPANSCLPFAAVLAAATRTLRGDHADSTEAYLRRNRSLSVRRCGP